MPAIAEYVAAFLDAHRIPHEIVTDPATRASQPPDRGEQRDEGLWVSAWVLAIGERYALLVLPMHQPPALGLLNQRHQGHRVRLASETEIEHLFADCDEDAVPPCGAPYGVPVYVSDELATNEQFICPSGRAGTWLRLDREAFEQLAQPHWLTLPPDTASTTLF